MKILALAAGLVIIIATGVVHGDLTGRWGASRELDRAVNRLEAIPSSVGEWKARDFELDPAQIEIGEIAGYMARRYVNQAGIEHTVMLVCGRPGPISAHTPEWCYGGTGYHAEGAPAVESLEAGPDGPASFWVNIFRKQRVAVPEDLEICWSWNAGGGWQAPENARLAFAPVRYLYKLYVVRDASADGDRGAEAEERRAFIRELIPSIDAALFGRDAS